MKTPFAGWMLLVGLVGCSGSDSVGPTATSTRTPTKPVVTTANKPIAGEADNTFSLSVPFQAITLKQGEEMAVVIGINRGANFGEEVALKVAGFPEGVTLDPTDPVIKPGSTVANLVLKAERDAALGDFTVKVTGQTASSGADSSNEFKITVTQ